MVGARRWERGIAIAVLSAAMATPWYVAGLSPAQAGVLMSATVLLVLWGLWRAGWLGGSHRIERIVWQADGLWLLIDRSGVATEAALHTGTRAGAGYLWLCWSANRTRSMVLAPGDVAAVDLRRLAARLRIQGLGRESGMYDTVP